MLSGLKQTFAGVTKLHWLIFLGCWLGGIFDGMDSSLYMVIQHDALADLLATTDRTAISTAGSWIMSTFLLGWTLGGIVFGYIGDRFGRVTAMVGSILLYAIFTGAAGFVTDPWQLALCRFLTGFGIGGELVSITTMLAESWPARSRAIVLGLLITSYQMGVFLAGLIPASIYVLGDSIGVAPWRLVFFVGVLPALLAIVIRLRMDESPLWLAEQHEHSTAQRSTFGEHMAALGQQISVVFNPQYRRDVFLGGLIFGGLLVGYWASLAWIPTWIQDMLGSTGNGTEKSWATMLHGLAAVLGCGLAGVVANQIGRRWTIIGSYVGMFLATCWLMLGSNTFTDLVYVQDALLGFFGGLSQAIMYVYLPELFPTKIRASAIGFCLNMGRLVTTVAVIFVGPTVSLLGGYAMALLAFSTSYLIAAIGGYLARETKNQTVLPA
jgi:MFS family permease